MMTGYAHLLDDAPFPRLCHIKKWSGCDGYGFNLHGVTGEPGHFIGSIDPDSPAEATGLKTGDRLIEVNGKNIQKEDHKEVIERIKSDPRETCLLVVDQFTYLYYQRRNVDINDKLPNVKQFWTPNRHNPAEGMKPRFCFLKTWPDFIGYGFTIQSDLNKSNPVICEVDSESPAEHSGLRKGDKLVEINDTPIYSSAGEIPYNKILRLIRSNPSTLKLLVVEERFFEKFVSLRSEGSYKDDLIEVIICPAENPKRNEDVSFRIESAVSSVNASPKPIDHSTPKRQNSEKSNGKHNSAFVTDEEILPNVTITPVSPEATPPPSSPSSCPITLKYCEIPSAKGMLSFGFNIVAEKPKPGNYFENVESSSPAHDSGLKDGDYLVAVNGSLAYKDSHQEAVEKIKQDPSIVKLIVTDKYGFEQIYCKSEREVQDVIDSKFQAKGKISDSAVAQLERSFHSRNEPEETSAAKDKPEDDSISIDYKQVAEEMVQLALKEANQDNIELQEVKGHRDEKNDTLTRSNQLPQAPSSQSLEDSPSSFSSTKRTPDYSSLPSSKSNQCQPITMAGLKFSATAAEARKNMKKKSDVRNSGMSLKDKYNLLKGL